MQANGSRCLELMLFSTCELWRQVYIIEANPRASRTVPFVAKAIGHPLATYASLLMAGQTLKDLDFLEEPTLNHVAVKEAVLPFEKFAGERHCLCSYISTHFFSSAVVQL